VLRSSHISSPPIVEKRPIACTLPRKVFESQSRALLSLFRIIQIVLSSRASALCHGRTSRGKRKEKEKREDTRARDNLSPARRGSNIELRSAMRVSHPPRARPLLRVEDARDIGKNASKISLPLFVARNSTVRYCT